MSDITQLLAAHIRPGDKVLEIGCAPGKFLLWCGMIAKAHVTGIEYAPKSYADTAQLFQTVGQTIDLRLEDVFATKLGAEFDVVYSLGLIEHFFGEQLNELVAKHVALLRPGGTAIIVIPNYAGPYGWVLSRFNRPNYDTHNIDLMSPDSLRATVPNGVTAEVFRYGRFTPWVVSFGLPTNLFARLALYALNTLGLVQPFKIPALCPWLVLVMKR